MMMNGGSGRPLAGGMMMPSMYGMRTGYGNGSMHSMRPQVGGGLDSLSHRQGIREEDAIKMALAKCKEQPGCKVELDDLPAKKWQKDTKKYFNYNFNEYKWRMYANKQYKMRKLVENISALNTNKENFVVRPTIESFRARIAVEYPEGSLGDVPDAILEATPLDHRFIDRGFEIPDMYGFSDVIPTLVTAENLQGDGDISHTDDGSNTGDIRDGDGNGKNGDFMENDNEDGEKGRKPSVSGEKRPRTFPESERQKNDEEISNLVNFLKNYTKPWTPNNSNFVPAKRQKFGDK